MNKILSIFILLMSLAWLSPARATNTDALLIMGSTFSDQTTGIDNGVINPGDSVQLTVALQAAVLKYGTIQTYSNVVGTLNSSDPCVSITTSTVSYGTVSSSATSTPQTPQGVVNPFILTIAPLSSSCPVGHLINFNLTINANAFTTQNDPVSVLIGSQTMQVVSWSTAGASNIIMPVYAAIGGSCGQGQSDCMPDGNLTAQHVANIVIPQLLNRPPGTRILQLWQEADDIVCYAVPQGYQCAGQDSDGDPNFAAVQPNATLIQNKKAWFQQFFQYLKNAGVTVDMVVMDQESGWSIWGFNLPQCGDLPAMMQRLYTKYGSLMSTAVQNDIKSDLFENCSSADSYGHNAFIDWDEWAGKELQAVYQTAIIGVLKSYFPLAVASQYQDSYSQVAQTDLNNWPTTPSDTQLGDTTSPALYIFGGGNKYLYSQKITPWNRFLDEINQVRTAMQVNASHPVVPWLSYPGQNQDSDTTPVSYWFWDQMFDHMAQTGITQAHYFNPGIPAAADQHASDVIAETPIQNPQTNLPLLGDTTFYNNICIQNNTCFQYDTCLVTTGNFTTTYAEFLKNYTITYALNTNVCSGSACTSGLNGTGGNVTLTPIQDSHPCPNQPAFVVTGQNNFMGYTWVQMTAAPAPGYQFSGWSGSASGAGTSTNVMMSGNQTVTATFTPLMPTVSAGSSQTITLPAGANLSATVTPSTATISWSQISGPGTASFSQSNSLTPTVSFTQPGTYKLCATVSANGLQAASNVTIIVNPSLPSVPSGLTATASTEQVNLTWTASNAASSYTIKRSTDASHYSNIASGITNTTYNDGPNPALTNGTTYYYEVQAVNVTGSSYFSSSASATPEPPIPSTPSLTATAGDGQVSLSWSASGGASSYALERSTNSSGAYASLASGLTATSYIDSSALDGTTYYYKIQAVNGGGNSPLSLAVSATPLKIYTITATAGSGGNITPSGNVSVTSGSNQAFSITASSGYGLIGVSIDGQNQTQPLLSTYTFNNVTGSHSIQANFGQIPVISAQPASQIVLIGQTTSFSVSSTGTGTLNYQWQKKSPSDTSFSNVGANQNSYTTPTVSSADNGTIYSVIVSDAAGNVTSQNALLTVGYTLNVASPNGAVQQSPSQNIYTQGSSVTLTPATEIGYVFSSWSGDITGASSVGNTLTVSMNQNLNITANYVAIPTYSLTVNVSPQINGASVQESPAQGVYNQGSNVTLTAVAPSGYQFSSWSGDVGTINPNNPAQMTVVINRATNTTANFIVVPLTTGGNPPPTHAPMVSVSGDQSVSLQDTATLNANVNTTSQSEDVNVTWSQESGPGSVTFEDEHNPKTTATFSQSGVYKLKVTADDGQSQGSDEITVQVN